jgi:protein translocase SecG subunit
MSMSAQVIQVIQLSLSLIVILLVTVQQSEASLGSLSGADTTITHHTRRGFEKFLFIMTIILGALLVAVSIMRITAL